MILEMTLIGYEVNIKTILQNAVQMTYGDSSISLPKKLFLETHSSILAWEIPLTEKPGYSSWGRKRKKNMFERQKQ